jgi:hypothetical protein
MRHNEKVMKVVAPHVAVVDTLSVSPRLSIHPLSLFPNVCGAGLGVGDSNRTAFSITFSTFLS